MFAGDERAESFSVIVSWARRLPSTGAHHVILTPVATETHLVLLPPFVGGPIRADHLYLREHLGHVPT